MALFLNSKASYMLSTSFGISFAMGLAIAAVCSWAFFRVRTARLFEQLRSHKEQLTESQSRYRQSDERLKQQADSILNLSTQLASVCSERDALKPLEAQTRQLNEKLEAQGKELATTLSNLAATTAMSDSLQRQLQDASTRIAQLETEREDSIIKTQQLIATQAELKTSLESERIAMADKLQILQGAENRLSITFDALAAKALKENSADFLQLANNKLEEHQHSTAFELEARKDAIGMLLNSATNQLRLLDDQVRAIETNRQTGQVRLEEQITSLVNLQHKLSEETRRLSKALERPTTRGSWGEIQLRRVAELAGMIEYCDFRQQATIIDDEGKRLRPDVIVTMPNQRTIAVDSKVSLEAYIEAANADSEDKFREFIAEHTTQIKKHISDLSSKNYWSQLPNSPDLTVAFIPSEALYSAALQSDPSLLEFAISQRVLIATPTTLIALLRAVYYGWREEKLAASAQEVSELGRALYKRLVILGDHLTNLGKSIKGAVEHYNKVVGSIELSVFPSARKFSDLGASSTEPLPLLEPIEKMTREPQSPNWKKAVGIEAEVSETMARGHSAGDIGTS
jgi:DNA recombination protein RmuC